MAPTIGAAPKYIVGIHADTKGRPGRAQLPDLHWRRPAGPAELLAPHIAGRQVAIVSNETVAPLYLERLSKTLGAYSVLPVVLPDGEAYKNWETLQLIFDGLLTARHDRRTTVVALGGGVVGDMAGFAAACYQRGVDFIQVPTTLLSQVDSSVGGKTGINHPLGKNMVGAFYQPMRC